jgi:hypothetical protein
MARGEVPAITSDTDGALVDWLRALEIDADHIGLVYSSALLEPAGRPAEAIAAWRFIVACNQAPASLPWSRPSAARRGRTPATSEAASTAHR